MGMSGHQSAEGGNKWRQVVAGGDRCCGGGGRWRQVLRWWWQVAAGGAAVTFLVPLLHLFLQGGESGISKSEDPPPSLPTTIS